MLSRWYYEKFYGHFFYSKYLIKSLESDNLIINSVSVRPKVIFIKTTVNT